jgi:hypothetical protein
MPNIFQCWHFELPLKHADLRTDQLKQFYHAMFPLVAPILLAGGPDRHSIWYLEMASQNSMMRQGWMPNTVKPGDVVTLEAYAAKDYPTGGKIHRVKVPDGRWLFADSGGPNGPQPEVRLEK